MRVRNREREREREKCRKGEKEEKHRHVLGIAQGGQCSSEQKGRRKHTDSLFHSFFWVRFCHKGTVTWEKARAVCVCSTQ